MKLKHIFLFSVLLLAGTTLHAQIFMGKTCEITFFSNGPVEDITAKSTSSKPILNTKTNEIAVKVTIKGFVFDKKLMEEHFNEKYMESDKFPYATFSGKINELVDYTKDSTHKVTVTGKLNMHGVEKNRTIDGTLTVKGGEISVKSNFNIAMKDHNIDIPSLVTDNIAEVVEVTIKSILTEFKK